MSESKDPQDDHDPDYDVPGPSNEKHQKLFEEHARTNVVRKITAIVEKEFSREIDAKEKEILEIEERLQKALKTLHFLRYVIITDFYNRKQCQNVQLSNETKQTRIHPAIKQMIGKSPKIENNLGIPSTSKNFPLVVENVENSATNDEWLSNVETKKRLENFDDDSIVVEIPKKRSPAKRNRDDDANEAAPMKKIPRYVPPKSGIPEPQTPSRGARHKVRKRIVVGNISKWIPPDWREDAASHKWTMYVRGGKENAEIGDFVGKVRFFLHPSYRPNDVVEVTSPPFHLSRRGWGEFPLRVQLHFKNPLNKPMDIIHYLKLDRTYTGLQTLGSETVVDVWIKASPDSSSSNEYHSSDDVSRAIKSEPHESSTTNDDRSDDKTFNDHENSRLSSLSEKIKLEPSETLDEASHVRLEHDYANFSFDNSTISTKIENNVTISHSPIRNCRKNNDEKSSTFDSSTTNGDGENFAIATKRSAIREEIVETTETDANLTSKDFRTTDDGKNSKTDETQDIGVDASAHFFSAFADVDSSKMDASVDFRTSMSGRENCSSKFQPLKITIPANFEAPKKITKAISKPKQILILKDNKLISIGSMNRGKIGSTLGRGVSLLKKSSIGKDVEKNEKPEGTVVFRLNPTNSLILNAASDVPALKIAEPTRTSSAAQKISNVGEISKNEDSKISKNIENSSGTCENVGRTKITLGKDRIGTTSKKEIYDEILRSIDEANITDVAAIVRFVIRRLPLVTEKATDPEYRSLHPYACSSDKEFLDSNVGKQRALEWYRAKHVKSFINKKCTSDDVNWTVKEIMIWSRLHGYTPMRSLPIIGSHRRNTGVKSSEKNIPGDDVETKNVCTFTEPLALVNYLRDVRETKSSATISEIPDNDVEILDVESIVEKNGPRDVSSEKLEERDEEARTRLSLGIPEKIVPLETYVTNTARQIGIKLGPEEIVAGVTHCAAARAIVRSLQCLIEDLLRSSLAKAWERSSDGGCPDTITVEDVRGAILSRDEFDVFTNEGLGSHHCPND